MKQSAVGYRNIRRPFPLRRDYIAVIAGDVIMSKVVLDISRETRPLRGRSSTRADFPTSDASPEPYAGTPAPPGRSPSRPAAGSSATTGNECPTPHA